LLRPGATTAQPPTPAPRDTTLATGLAAGEADAEPRRRNFFGRKSHDAGFTTLDVGAALLLDFVTYAQDQASRQQIELEPGFRVRDARFQFGGRFRIRRPVTWKAGVMYDGPSHSWLVRQTGIMVAIPELWGHIFVGRTKEGVSLSRVMSRYDVWTMERFTFSDAAIPALADGVKWLGYVPNRHFLWNVGWFTDVLSEGQSFLVVRQPVYRARRVGSSPAPYFIDTGEFPARSTRMAGPEIYYRPGNWLFGTEYYWQKVGSPQMNNPLFHGGDAFVAWVITGETRSYNTVGGYFRSIAPAKTILQRGPGVWEALLRFSYSDLNDGPVQGGRFWRLTPTVNWYFTDVTRLELAYGYGTLDRFENSGVTQFFQARLQIEF